MFRMGLRLGASLVCVQPGPGLPAGDLLASQPPGEPRGQPRLRRHDAEARQPHLEHGARRPLHPHAARRRN